MSPLTLRKQTLAILRESYIDALTNVSQEDEMESRPMEKQTMCERFGGQMMEELIARSDFQLSQQLQLRFISCMVAAPNPLITADNF